MNQPILLYRSGSVYANETAAWAALDAVTHTKGQPIVAFYTLSNPTSGHHGSSTIGAIFAIGIGDGVGQYKACTSHDDMLIVAQSLNAHITQFNQMFEYDANHNAIKAKLDFYTTDGKSISAGGIGSGSSASLGALYQLVDVMANSSNTGVEGAVEGSVLAYDATAGKWKAIAQSEILPDMSGYYTKDETNAAINDAKSNLQGQVDTLHALIPATATADNQLADKDFVNSSIATATAEFKGSFTSLDELKATSGNLNDYAFYLHTDNIGNKVVDRYKWTTAGWLYEYTLNNSSFTAEQWAALNSAITATLVQSYNNHLNNSTIHITAAERTAWNNKWDYNEETIKGVKVNAAVLSDSATKLATARKIWGRPFDGSDDVSGDLKEVGNISASGKATIQGDIVCGGEVAAIVGDGTPAGVTDYSALTGKPQINGVTLVSGNNTLASLGIQAAGDYATNSGVATLLAGYADKTFVSNNYVGKSAFNSHTADTDIHITAAERNAWNAKWNYDEATIKAVKVNSASSADSVAWANITNKPSTFTPSAHTHTASEVSGLPTKLSAFTNDAGYITGITKSMVEGVLTGNITSHTHSYLPLSGGTIEAYDAFPLTIKVSSYSNLLTFITTDDTNNDIERTVIGYYALSTRGSEFRNATSGSYIGITDNGTPHYNGNTLIHAGNYNSYSPTLTGTGASGTWGINISGNAASADVIAKTYFNQSINFTHYDSKIRLISIGNGDASGNGFPNENVGGISVISSYVGWQMVSYASWAYPNPYFRHIYDNDNWSDWKQLAFLTDNVASATKLQTPRTLWGKPFDGSGDVSGNINLNTGKLFWHDDANSYYIGTSNTISSSAPNIDYVGYSGHRFICVAGEVMRINSNGNTLISTTTDAGYKFAVNGSALVNTVRTQELRLGETNPDSAHTQNKWYYATIGYEYEDASPSTLKPAIVFKSMYDTYSEDSGNELMRIRANGNVLIGTTTDRGHRLTIGRPGGAGILTSTTLNNSLLFVGISNSVDSYGMNFWTEGSGNGFIQQGRTDEEQPAMYNLSLQPFGGRVGIGTTNPQYHLDVNGTGHYSGDLIVDGEVSALVA